MIWYRNKLHDMTWYRNEIHDMPWYRNEINDMLWYRNKLHDMVKKWNKRLIWNRKPARKTCREKAGSDGVHEMRRIQCEFSGFLSGALEFFDLLGYYAASFGSCLPTFWGKQSFLECLKTGPIGCPETSVKTCNSKDLERIRRLKFWRQLRKTKDSVRKKTLAGQNSNALPVTCYNTREIERTRNKRRQKPHKTWSTMNRSQVC
jgi:hypothetical protein